MIISVDYVLTDTYWASRKQGHLQNRSEIRLWKSGWIQNVKRTNKLVIWGPGHPGGTQFSEAAEHLWSSTQVSAVSVAG